MTTNEFTPEQPDPKEDQTEPAAEFEKQDPRQFYLDELMEYQVSPVTEVAYAALEAVSKREKTFRVLAVNFEESIEVWKVRVEMESRAVRTVTVVAQDLGNDLRQYTCFDPAPESLAVVEAAQLPNLEREIW